MFRSGYFVISDRLVAPADGGMLTKVSHTARASGFTLGQLLQFKQRIRDLRSISIVENFGTIQLDVTSQTE